MRLVRQGRRSCAKVTRSALYHHFEDKRDLFRAVHEQIEAELTEAIGADLAGSGSDDAVEALRTAARTFLDACTEPEIARITLLDAPSVLGWEEWRRIDQRYGVGLTMAGLQMGIESGRLRRPSRRRAGDPCPARWARGRLARRAMG